MAFRTRIPVRFGDEDHAQIVYYPRFFHFFHVALEDFFGAHGHPYARILDVDRVGFPTVRVESEFMRTVRFGDVLEIEISVVRIGTSSATLRYVAHKPDGPAAKADITVVCVSMDTWKPVAVPPVYRAILERHRVEGA